MNILKAIRLGTLIAAFILLSVAHSNAQREFTLAECIGYAFEHNPALNAIAKDTLIAGLGTQRVSGLYLPRANFASAFQYYIATRKTLVEGGSALAPPSLPEGEPMALDVGYKNSWYPTFNVNQLIFDPSYRNNYNIALQNQQLQSQELVSFKIDVVTGITKAFNTCKLLELQARFLEGNITRIDSLAELTRIKFTEGAGVKIEVNRVEVTANRMRSELANVQGSYNEALVALQFQMNYLEAEPMILTSNLTVGQIVDDSDELLLQLSQGAPDQRIENQLLQTQISLADESIKLEQSRALPVVGADGSVGFTPGANEFSNMFQGERWRPYSYIGINVGIPIFNGMDVKRAVDQRKLTAQQSRDYLDQFNIQFESEKAITEVQIQMALERFKYADANLKLANNNIELLHEAFVNGVADNQDMILGENDLYDNQARYFNELLQLMLSEIEGQRVVGLFNSLAGL
ncbi:TolC family protein [Algoriphagus terrigena]|uniref:TolC family protein n=1 Tax=Algoriphagus terrigena TaxID=344884 RepID=UPI00047CBA58|nr:TolC family protein [Algoriphagus terrigena]